jgi:hypothetical protein
MHLGLARFQDLRAACYSCDRFPLKPTTDIDDILTFHVDGYLAAVDEGKKPPDSKLHANTKMSLSTGAAFLARGLLSLRL